MTIGERQRRTPEEWKGCEVVLLESPHHMRAVKAGTRCTVELLNSGGYFQLHVTGRPELRMMNVRARSVAFCNDDLMGNSMEQLLERLPAEGMVLIGDYEHVYFSLSRLSDGTWSCDAMTGTSNTVVMDTHGTRVSHAHHTPHGAVVGMLNWLDRHNIRKA